MLVSSQIIILTLTMSFKNFDKKKRNNLTRDLIIVLIGVVLAVALVKTGVVKSLVVSGHDIRFLGNFLAGIFFISVFTAAPAAVVLVELAQTNSAWEVALFGGLGALVGDLIIFKFLKDNLADDLFYLIENTGLRKITAIFKSKFLKWIIPFFGAIIIASPFPDELGLVMMGLSKTKTWIFIPISFILNFLGILSIGLIAERFIWY